jgi:hypothetical protein
MEEKRNERELVIFLELLTPHIVHLNAITELLIEKGIFTRQEFYARRKQVQRNYERKMEDHTNDR